MYSLGAHAYMLLRSVRIIDTVWALYRTCIRNIHMLLNAIRLCIFHNTDYTFYNIVCLEICVVVGHRLFVLRKERYQHYVTPGITPAAHAAHPAHTARIRIYM